jgi:amino acid transporter
MAGTGLQRHFGLLQATALNVTLIIGSGVFVTIPLMLKELPGPYALLGWLVAGGLVLVDGLIWSELGAAFPGSGGSYLYLLECYGRERWGRLMAFLFIWQFIISGPLELASALIATDLFSGALHPDFAEFSKAWTVHWELTRWAGSPLEVTFGPSRLLGFLLGVAIIGLLYRRITTLGKLTVTFWLGVLGVCAWILVEGGFHFNPEIAFDFSGRASAPPDLVGGLGAAMILALYAYLGYYNVCYIGDEVRDPGRVIPRSILLSSLFVCALFVGLHLAMLGVVSWSSVPMTKEELDAYNLPAVFMNELHGPLAASLVSLLLIWSCFGSAFCGMLGYSRIPYGAARYGHFFSALGKVHPVRNLPHMSLLLVGGLTLFWSFFGLGDVINALITTRILNQFIGQVFAVVLLRHRQPERLGPYRMWLYPVPCALAFVGWLYVYLSASKPFIILGLVTLGAGVVTFFPWAYRIGEWPFNDKKTLPEPEA